MKRNNFKNSVIYSRNTQNIADNEVKNNCFKLPLQLIIKHLKKHFNL